MYDLFPCFMKTKAKKREYNKVRGNRREEEEREWQWHSAKKGLSKKKNRLWMLRGGPAFKFLRA